MEKFFFGLVILTFVKPSQGNDSLNIAVASNFNSTLEKISFQYEKKKRFKINIISGSSGVLFAQIINGAPYDVFFSADRDRPEKLDSKGINASTGDICIWSGSLLGKRRTRAGEISISEQQKTCTRST